MSLRLEHLLAMDAVIRSAVPSFKESRTIFLGVAVLATRHLQTSPIGLVASLEVMQCLAASRVKSIVWSRRSSC
jgi:hypothetical protein